MKGSIFFILWVILVSCTEDTSIVPSNPRPVWLVPEDEVLDGGVGRDGIPSVDHPQFEMVEMVNPVFNDELVIGIEVNGSIHGYPVPILDWHEIVNDEVNGLHIAITYCPLTGTGIGWNRKLGSTVTTFGVSGLLYNSNLMPYDRRTLSIWSQQRLECVNGTRIGSTPESVSLIETTLATWRKSFPNSKIMNANTGFDRSYSFYPYGQYRTNHDQLFFPVASEDNRLPQKERVLGVLINGSAKAYRFNNAGEGTEVIHDRHNQKSILIVRSKDDNYNTAFFNPEGKLFEAIQDSLPFIMKDNLANYYDLAGRVLSGPGQDEKLMRPVSFIGYWFSWPAFYPDISLYQE